MPYQNPEKSRDFIFKNPGIGIQVQSRDPGIFRDPAGHCPPKEEYLGPPLRPVCGATECANAQWYRC